MFRSKSIVLVLSLLAIVGMVLSACAPAATSTPAPAATSAPAPAATTAPAPAATTAPAPTAAPAATKEPAGSKSKDPTVLNYQTFGDPDTLDPHIDYETAGGGILYNIYEGLVTFDGPDPAKFKPVLAEAIPDPVKNDDGSVTYVWNIIKGVKFANGDELTAEDVAFSFWRSLMLGDPNAPTFLMTESFFTNPESGNVVDDPTELVDPSGKLVGDPETLKAAPAAKLEAACQMVKDAITFDEAARTVTMKLDHPWGPFIATIAQRWAGVMDKKWLVEQGDWDGDCKTWQNFYGIPTESGIVRDKVNGTGPYTLDHWTPNEEIVLVANPNWRGEAPKIQRVVIKNVTEFGTRFAALQAGDADLISLGSVADRAQMDTLVGQECDWNTGECKDVNPDGILRAYPKGPSLTRTDIYFNFDTGANSPYIGSGKLDGQGVPPTFFTDVHVRRAFNYCFDYDTYNKDVLLDDATRAMAVTLPGQLGYEGQKWYDYDLAKCEEEFKASTWKTEDGKSLWDAGFYMQITYNAGNTGRQAIAEILAGSLQQVNPNFFISPLTLPWPTFLRELRGGTLPLATSGWQEDIHDPHNWYVPYLLTTYASRFHVPADLTDKYRPLIDSGAKEVDNAKRAAIYTELNNLINQDAPFILLSVANAKRYEPRYLKGWWGGQSQNPLVSPPGDVYSLSKD